MSKFTLTVKEICERYYGEADTDYTQLNEVVEKGIEGVFDFELPIFDEEYTTVIEAKILRHFLFREICVPNVMQWKMYLRQKLEEVLPYYNQLYKSETLKFNPLYDMDLHTEKGVNKSEDDRRDGSETNRKNENTTDNSTTTGIANGSSQNMGANSESHTVSDTPQNRVSNVRDGFMSAADFTDGTENMMSTNKSDTKYDRNGARMVDTNQEKTKQEQKNKNTVESYVQHVYGKVGGYSQSKALMEYRQTMLNIDAMLMGELEVCFFQLWE